MMRKKIVAGNWKMNLNWNEAKTLFQQLQSIDNKEVEVIVFPSTAFLSSIVNEGGKIIQVGAQNGYPKDSGAYTGESSFSQLKSIGINYSLVGHSERRDYFCESNQFLKEKIDACLYHKITPLFCCGEPLSVREKKDEKKFVTQQISESLFHLTSSEILKCIIAYEPIWAIGTGLTASCEQAEEMHLTIRIILRKNTVTP